jgi:phospholipid/cholesterol/gamma-HCH transport system substrate-binding protein
MVTKSQKIRLGIFITVAVIVLLSTVAVVLVPRYFETRDTYFIGFRDISITGLIEGGTVKYHGLNVGSVSRIFIDPKDIRRVIVEVSLDHGTPIKEDTEAEINFLGITGLKVIELVSGSNESNYLLPGGFIKPGRSITEEITGKAEVIAGQAERVLNNIATLTDAANRERIVALADNTNRTLTELYDLLQKNNQAMTNTLANAEVISVDLRETAGLARRTMGNVRSLSRSDSLRQILGNFAEFSQTLKEADLVRLILELNQTLDRSNRMLAEVEKSFARSHEDVVETITAARETIDNLNQFSRLISEDPSILLRGGKAKDAPDYLLEK